MQTKWQLVRLTENLHMMTPPEPAQDGRELERRSA
jgi:hypothetical protein